MSVLDLWPDEVLGHLRHLAAQPVVADLSHVNAADTARVGFA
jgi:hypothetical protein